MSNSCHKNESLVHVQWYNNFVKSQVSKLLHVFQKIFIFGILLLFSKSYELVITEPWFASLVF
jgi:hypothetical protein